MVQEIAEEDENKDYVPDLQKIQSAAKHQVSPVNDMLAGRCRRVTNDNARQANTWEPAETRVA